MTEAPTAPTRERVALGNPSFVWRAGQDRRLALVQRYVALEHARVLDIGCGIGTYVRKLREVSKDAYGIDVDVARLGQATTNGLAAAASEQLPFGDGAFDVVLLNEVIEHVRDDAATLREACRVVRPGGHVAVYAPNRLYPFETHGVYLGRRYVFGNIPLVNYLPNRLRRRLVPHARAYTSGNIRRLITGLPASPIVCTQVFPGFDNIAARSRALGWLLRNVFHRLEATPLRAFGLSHFVILRVRGSSKGERHG
ncbi:MAG: methyltransferase domain-containing protein [Dehalococcoidia bacterium]|nr:methyltransferase domain-containing protein [Dehalococcoidia bacterium]